TIFNHAKGAFRDAFGNDIAAQIQSEHGIQGVLDSLRISENTYSNQAHSKAWKWARRLSEKILYYGHILDIISQHHPEYVALAWGAMKFLLGVLNYESLVKELSKALCRIAEALRYVEAHLSLYPIKIIEDAVSELYCHIMEFTVRAIRWYQKPRPLRALSALGNPFPLKFRDIVENIQETSRSIDRMALTMSHIELRQLRLEHKETRDLLMEINRSLQDLGKLQYSGIIDTNRRITEVQFSQILSFLSVSPFPSPANVRQNFCARRSIRRRASQQSHVVSNHFLLQKWGEGTSSSQILVQGSFNSRLLTRDFAVDIIDLVSKAGVPVVWALNPGHVEHDSTPMDVLKYITCQVLQLNQTMLDERSASLNACRFQSTVSESGWFSILGAALEGLKQIYIIVDLELLEKSGGASSSWMSEFPRLFAGMRDRGLQTSVKVAFISPVKKMDEPQKSLEMQGLIRIARPRSS
ncbi:Nacht domain protein, partial [Colletotrichum asianum]